MGAIRLRSMTPLEMETQAGLSYTLMAAPFLPLTVVRLIQSMKWFLTLRKVGLERQQYLT